MATGKWDRLEALFHELSGLPEEERRRRLATLARTAPSDAAELATLLAHQGRASEWFRASAPWIASDGEPSAAHPGPDPLLGRQVLHYRVDAPLGRGGMGVVYRATDVRLGRAVALKFLHPGRIGDEDARAALLAEARAAAALDHPHLCTIHDVGETDDGLLFIAMAYYEGRTLKAVLKEEGALVPERALAIAHAIASALAAAHAAGVVHRDVKPANVLLTAGGDAVKLLDFGIAHRTRASARAGPATAGTLAYMSPEQLAGGGTDARTDLWGLGVTLWEMLAGQRPFRAPSRLELVDTIELDAPALTPAPVDLPPGAVTLVESLLRKDPAERPASAAAVRDALAGLLLPPRGPVETEAEARSRRIPVGALNAALIVLALAAAVVLVRVARDPPGTRDTPTYSFRIPAPGPLLSWSWIDLSPDGHLLVHAAAGNGPLGIQDLRTGEHRALVGSEGALNPFFHPDGRQVAYQRGTALALELADVSGAHPTRTLGALPFQAEGLTFVDSARLVAADRAVGLRVAPVGPAGMLGPLRSLTSTTALGHLGHAHPRAIPGREAVLFEIRRSAGIRLGVVDLRDGRVRELDVPGQTPRWAEGHVIYTAFAELHALPFDTATLQPTGPPRPLGLPVNARSNARDFALAGPRLAYLRPLSDDRRLVEVDSAGQPRPLVRRWQTFLHPQWSPDGRSLVYVNRVAPRPLEMFVLEPVSGRLTGFQRDRQAQRPLWTDNGDSLVFTGIDPARGGAAVFKRASDGGGVERVVVAGGRVGVATSRDGRWVVFRELATDRTRALDLRTHDTLELSTHGIDGSVAFAPDGRRIAYTRTVAGAATVFVRSFPPLAEPVVVSSPTGRDPRWGRDGNELFYRSGPDVVRARLVPEPALAVAERTTLFSAPYDIESGWDVHPGGQRFLFVEARQDSATVVVRPLPVG